MVAELEIVCVVHDVNKVITHVGIRYTDIRFPVQSVAENITKGTYAYFTMKARKRAEVLARKHHISGRWFLTTDPDDTKENNLDFLPNCPIR